MAADWITARQIESARVALTRHMKRGGQVWVRVFPDKSVTKKAAETRMGGGKAAVDYWAAVVKPGKILFEVAGVPQEEAMEALRYMTGTEGLAGSAKYISYAPWRVSSLDIIAAGEPWFEDGKTNILPHIPTAPANTENYILMEPDYWADNEVEVGEAWEAFKASLKNNLTKID